MKFSVASNDLLKQLQIAGGAISSNPVLPILEDFLFQIENNKLIIAATDLETSITTELEILSDGDGMFAVPAKILTDTLKALPQQPITISINDATHAIEITSAYGKYKLAGENGADYPTIPQAGEEVHLTLPVNTLTQGIAKTIFATSNDELRLSMTGVYFQIEPDKLNFVATDAHKLVRYEFNDIKNDGVVSFIVPKKALNLLKNALPQNGEVHISYNKSNAFFSFGNVKMVCRLIDARYPDYNAVIPKESPHKLTVNRNDLLQSLKRIAIYANKTTNQVVFNINDKSLTISAQDLDFSNEATEQLTCEYSGTAMTIAFNAKFLLEMLAVLEGDSVCFELSTPSRAGILRPVDNVQGEDILMLVMPVMLSN
jgi:DNA polymerase-3 subunit beta